MLLLPCMKASISLPDGSYVILSCRLIMVDYIIISRILQQNKFSTTLADRQTFEQKAIILIKLRNNLKRWRDDVREALRYIGISIQGYRHVLNWCYTVKKMKCR